MSGVVLVEPLGDAPGVGRGRPLAGDDGDDLVVVVVDQVLEQGGGGVGQVAGDDLDAVAGEAEVVALGDGAGVARAVAHGLGHLAGDDLRRELRS